MTGEESNQGGKDTNAGYWEQERHQLRETKETEEVPVAGGDSSDNRACEE
jgi:hypothetical protein